MAEDADASRAAALQMRAPKVWNWTMGEARGSEEALAAHDLEFGTLIELPLLELTFPHRMDVLIRVHALQAFDQGGFDEMVTGPYSWFISQWRFRDKPGPDAHELARRFVDLYDEVRATEYDESRAMTVVHAGNPHPAFLPPERRLATASIPFAYSLKDGAHRLAVLLHLGHRSARFRLVNEPAFTVPDYTTYCLQRLGENRPI